MLASLTPQQFDEWDAYHAVEPWGDDWRRTGTVAAELRRLGGDKPPKPDDFIPRVTWRSSAEVPATPTAEAMAAALYSPAAHAKRRRG